MQLIVQFSLHIWFKKSFVLIKAYSCPSKYPDLILYLISATNNILLSLRLLRIIGKYSIKSLALVVYILLNILKVSFNMNKFIFEFDEFLNI